MKAVIGEIFDDKQQVFGGLLATSYAGLGVFSIGKKARLNCFVSFSELFG